MALDLLIQLQGLCLRGVNVLLPKPVGLATGAFWACPHCFMGRGRGRWTSLPGLARSMG